jgi:hypothetical protein
MLLLTVRGLAFVSDHPYAAMGIFGAALGSAATYTLMTARSPNQNGIFTPKVYKLELPREDVEHLLTDPTTKLRWETPQAVVVVSMEQPEPLKQLPYINAEPA